jgi:hypothetical protein
MNPSRELCIMACCFCRDPVFWRWALGASKKCTLAEGEPAAKALILKLCQVTSRNDLDRDPAAAQLFHERVRKPFLEWKGEQGGAPC